MSRWWASASDDRRPGRPGRPVAGPGQSLIDVSGVADEEGFRIPVAITRAAWDRTVAWHAGSAGQSQSGRLHDVLFLASLAVRTADGVLACFEVWCLSAAAEANCGRDRVELVAYLGLGQDGQPLLTILLPSQLPVGAGEEVK